MFVLVWVLFGFFFWGGGEGIQGMQEMVNVLDLLGVVPAPGPRKEF